MNPFRRLAARSLWELEALGRGVLDLAFPPTCASCGDHRVPAPSRWMLCGECLSRAAAPLRPTCRRCGVWLPLAAGRPLACPYCHSRSKPWRLESLVLLGPYEGFHRELVLQMKRRKGESLAVAVGNLMGDRLRVLGLDHSIDAVVPLPVPLRRRLAGSFDRCSVLAERIAERLGRPFRRILRYRRTPDKQGLLTPRQRRLNVRGAFRVATRYGIRDARVLLVDDVATTGATACEAARVLLRAGAQRVDLAVVARAMPPSAASHPPPSSTVGSHVSQDDPFVP